MRIALVLLCAMALWPTGAARAEVMIFAPGSMAEALEAIAAEARGDGLALKVAGGHSPAQARQIAEGAPADIFVSADPQWVDFLAGKGLIVQSTRASLAATRLVVVAAPDSPIAYSARVGESLAAALGNGRLAVADPDSVPAGRFARQALQRLGAWDGVADRLALLPHVRGVVAMVERGEAPLGIGFASDVTGERKVKVITEFPSAAAPPVSYPLAVVSGHDRDEVRRAYDFLRGAEALAILKVRGFEGPPP